MKIKFLHGIVFFTALSLLGGCGAKKDEATIKYGNNLPGGARYGGVLNLNDPSYPVTLFPPHIQFDYQAHPATQIFEGLFKLNAKGKPELCLAASWEPDSTGLHILVKLKQGVYFHDSPLFENGKGREMVAADVCHALNSYFDRHHSVGHTVRFEELGRYRIKCRLQTPDLQLAVRLASINCAVYPQELERFPDRAPLDAVGTGPFVLATFEDDFFIDLQRNHSYHGADAHGNKLPFLDGISIRYINDKDLEVKEFLSGETDVFYNIPPKYIHEMETFRKNKAIYGLTAVKRNRYYFLWFNPIHHLASAVRNGAIASHVSKEVLVNRMLNGTGVLPKKGIDFWNHIVQSDTGTAAHREDTAMAVHVPTEKDIIELRLAEEDDDAKHVAPYIAEQLAAPLGYKYRLQQKPVARLMENTDVQNPAFILFYVESADDSVSLAENVRLQIKKTGFHPAHSSAEFAHYLLRHPAVLTLLWQQKEHIAISSKVEGVKLRPEGMPDYSHVYLHPSVIIK